MKNPDPSDRLFGMPINLSWSEIELLPAAMIFFAVARAGSFRAAASALKLSASTVSTRVAALEEQLGVRLLHRTTRSVKLTEAGQTLLEALTPIGPQWRQAEERARAHGTEPQGLVCVTAPDVFMVEQVVPAATAFLARFPATRFVFKTSLNTLPLIDQGIDLAVRAGPLPPSEHGAKQLWQGHHIAVATPGFLAEHPVRSPAELMLRPNLDLGGRRKLGAWTDATGAEHPHTPVERIEADTVQVFMALLAAGAGVAVLPELMAMTGLREGRFQRVLPGWVAEPVSFHLVTPSSRRHSAAVRRFAEALEARFTELLRAHAV